MSQNQGLGIGNVAAATSFLALSKASKNYGQISQMQQQLRREMAEASGAAIHNEFEALENSATSQAEALTHQATGELISGGVNAAMGIVGVGALGVGMLGKFPGMNTTPELDDTKMMQNAIEKEIKNPSAGVISGPNPTLASGAKVVTQDDVNTATLKVTQEKTKLQSTQDALTRAKAEQKALQQKCQDESQSLAQARQKAQDAENELEQGRQELQELQNGEMKTAREQAAADEQKVAEINAKIAKTNDKAQEYRSQAATYRTNHDQDVAKAEQKFQEADAACTKVQNERIALVQSNSPSQEDIDLLNARLQTVSQQRETALRELNEVQSNVAQAQILDRFALGQENSVVQLRQDLQQAETNCQNSKGYAQTQESLVTRASEALRGKQLQIDDLNDQVQQQETNLQTLTDTILPQKTQEITKLTNDETAQKASLATAEQTEQDLNNKFTNQQNSIIDPTHIDDRIDLWKGSKAREPDVSNFGGADKDLNEQAVKKLALSKEDREQVLSNVEKRIKELEGRLKDKIAGHASQVSNMTQAIGGAASGLAQGTQAMSQAEDQQASQEFNAQAEVIKMLQSQIDELKSSFHQEANSDRDSSLQIAAAIGQYQNVMG